ncbi:hypothetical protein ACEUZ9_002793 [Paracoccus litorisediminis]|uniref:hypothetical protein n=1 Tax=Paracoccus litorisediminis TaxID=2006130 RepID=UPI00372EADEE
MNTIENARIITISTVHLSPSTIEQIETHKGDIPEGPSIALRDEGFFINSYRGNDNTLDAAFNTGDYKH